MIDNTNTKSAIKTVVKHGKLMKFRACLSILYSYVTKAKIA